jgi:small subunit ribosomal protein S11
MAKVDKTDKADSIESVVDKKVEKKSAKGSKKSSYSKKKKIKKNILNGIAYVQSTFNNTIISIADTNGNVVSWASAGQKVLKVLENQLLMPHKLLQTLPHLKH